MRVKGWKSQNTDTNSTFFVKLKPISFKNPKNPFNSPTHSQKLCLQFINPEITVRRHWNIRTTTVLSLSAATTTATPWLYAAVDHDNRHQAFHALTFKPYPIYIDESKQESDYLTSFSHTDVAFDKLVTFVHSGVMVVLYGGGRLFGRLPLVATDDLVKWVQLSDERFDDVVELGALDREGGLFSINWNAKSRKLKLGKMVANGVEDGPGDVGWRRRIVDGAKEKYMVVRVEEKVFRVYKLTRIVRYRTLFYWDEIEELDDEDVALFVSKDCCFRMGKFVGKEYENCIVFSEAGFPRYGDDDGWEYDDGENQLKVFRLSDGSYGKVGGSFEFPEIDWSPPSWAFDVVSCSSSHSRSQSKGEPDEDAEVVESVLACSNNEDKEEQEGAEFDSNSLDQEQEERSDSDIQDQNDEEMHSITNAEDTSLHEDVPSSLFDSVSAVEEEVTKTLLRMNGGNEAVEKDSSRKNITLSALRACNSSTTKGCKSNAPTAKFEGFDIKSDLVPTLQKIWRNHGNIIENSTIRSGDIIGRALESLASMVQILENNPVQLLSDHQAEYLSTTISDLKIMGFKVHWLDSFVEKAVKLQKSKALVDSLNKLGQLVSQVKERRTILLDKVAELSSEENKLKKEIVKVSKAIPFSGEVKFDEPLGSGLT